MEDELTNTTHSRRPASWAIHDWVIGLLAGGAVGLIAGLFFTARVVESAVFPIGGAVLGAVLGVYALTRSHLRHGRFFTPAVIVSWVLLGLSTVFLVALASAIANFQ